MVDFAHLCAQLDTAAGLGVLPAYRAALDDLNDDVIKGDLLAQTVMPSACLRLRLGGADLQGEVEERAEDDGQHFGVLRRQFCLRAPHAGPLQAERRSWRALADAVAPSVEGKSLRMTDSADEAYERRAVGDRLWQMGLHEDTMLFQRGNLFLVAQSLLAVAFSTTSAADEQSRPTARVIAAFGIVLTLTWLYVGHRHLKYCQALHRRAAARFPDYAETRAICRQPGPGARPLIVYVLPLLAAVMWAVLLLIG